MTCPSGPGGRKVGKVELTLKVQLREKAENEENPRWIALCLTASSSTGLSKQKHREGASPCRAECGGGLF